MNGNIRNIPFSNEIFLAEKCSITDLRSFQPWTFGNKKNIIIVCL